MTITEVVTKDFQGELIDEDGVSYVPILVNALGDLVVEREDGTRLNVTEKMISKWGYK